MSTNQRFVFVDVRGTQDASDSQGGGSMNDQEDLSDQSEGESYSYSAPSGEPLSRDPSEPLFDADFQVRKCHTADCIILCHRPIISFIDLFFLCTFSPQSPPPAAQDSPVSDTADLLGLNSDPQPAAMSSDSSSAAHQGVQGGMKAAVSNSDLLDDLFAPPAGQPGAVQEDLFFSGPTSGATPDSKRTG